jgi:hypothetical protein
MADKVEIQDSNFPNANFNAPVKIYNGTGFAGARAENLPDIGTNYIIPKKFHADLDVTVKRNEKTGVKVAVYGFSGVGKSVGVVSWARTKKEFSVKCYIFVRNGDIFGQLAQFFIKNHKALGFDDKDKLKQIVNSDKPINPKEILEIVKDEWCEGRKLLILDDVMPENDVDVNELLESLKGLNFCVILTSRRPKNLFHHNQYLLLEFEASQELCMEVLASVYKDNQVEKEAAKEICKYVGNNTFAIEQIWNLANIEDDDGQKPTLQQLYEKIKQEKGLKNSILSKEDKNLFHKDGVYQTLELVWKKINTDSQELALVCGQMALAPIPQTWFDDLVRFDENSEKNKIVLIRWLLLDKNKENNTFKLHELWHKFLRYDKFEEREREDKIKFQRIYTETLLKITVTFRDPNKITKEDILFYTPLIPHLQELANICNNLTLDNYTDYIDINFKRYVLLVNGALANFYSFQDQHDEFINHYDEAIKYSINNRVITEKFFGKESHEYFATIHNLAGSYIAKSWHSEDNKLNIELLQKSKVLMEEIIDKIPQNTNQQKL